MCLLWFSLCHRHYQEDKVEDGWRKGQSWPGAGRVVHGCGGQLDPPLVPAVPLFNGRSWGLPSSLIGPGLVSPTGHQHPSSQEEELSWALLPWRRRRRQAGSWRLSLCSAGFLVDAGHFPERMV